MKRNEKRDDHSVKVTQCKRTPCRAIGKPPHEAEELLLPSSRDDRPGSSRNQAIPKLADLLSRTDG